MSKIEKIRIFNYPGCKIKYIDTINKLVSQAEGVEVFVEPFCGTVSVTLNLEKDFRRKVINDLSRDVMRIIKSFRDGIYSDLVEIYASVANEFGNIKEDKEAYYKFRDTYNERCYNKDMLMEGFFLYMASRAAINSLFRVGPRGFNQSYGARANTLTMTEEEFNRVQAILKECIFYNTGYTEILDIYDDENVLFFLDPPYVDRKIQGSYKDENLFNQDTFLSKVKNLKGKVIYTDVYSDYIVEQLGTSWKYDIFVDKKNVSPGRNKEDKIDYQEAIYYNF